MTRVGRYQFFYRKGAGKLAIEPSVIEGVGYWVLSNTELSLELWTVIAGISGFDD